MSVFSFAAARQNMLKSQILTGHVLSEPLLAALQEVGRETFVPQTYREVAYLDEEIPLGNQRFLMEPLAFARVLEKAALMQSDSVLVIGCATGYSAAILSRIVREVVAVESDAKMAETARSNLASCPNVTVFHAPLQEGCHSRAPYDAIVIEGAVEYVPATLGDQLKEGGRLFTFEREAVKHIGTSGLTQMVEYKKVHNALYRMAFGNASVAPLPEFKKPAGFVF